MAKFRLPNRMSNSDLERSYSVKEVAELTGEKEIAIRYLIKAGQLKSIKVGRKVRVLKSELVEETAPEAVAEAVAEETAPEAVTEAVAEETTPKRKRNRK